VIGSAPPQTRGLILNTARASYGNALNELLLIGAIVAFAAMVITFLTIRQRDFHVVPEDSRTAPAEQSAEVAA
jgi:hypothetical protein